MSAKPERERSIAGIRNVFEQICNAFVKLRNRSMACEEGKATQCGDQDRGSANYIVLPWQLFYTIYLRDRIVYPLEHLPGHAIVEDFGWIELLGVDLDSVCPTTTVDGSRCGRYHDDSDGRQRK